MRFSEELPERTLREQFSGIGVVEKKDKKSTALCSLSSARARDDALQPLAKPTHKISPSPTPKRIF
jgi:hypothetical protein